MIKKGSQNDRILKYLESHGSITTMEAFIELGVTRLSGRIYELKENGYNICGRDVKVPTRTGGMATVTEYSLC